MGDRPLDHEEAVDWDDAAGRLLEHEAACTSSDRSLDLATYQADAAELDQLVEPLEVDHVDQPVERFADVGFDIDL